MEGRVYISYGTAKETAITERRRGHFKQAFHCSLGSTLPISSHSRQREPRCIECERRIPTSKRGAWRLTSDLIGITAKRNR